MEDEPPATCFSCSILQWLLPFDIRYFWHHTCTHICKGHLSSLAKERNCWKTGKYKRTSSVSNCQWISLNSSSNGSSKLQYENQWRLNIKDEAFISGRFERSGRESDGKEIGHKICELLNTRADDGHGGMFPSLRADLQRPVADSDQVRQSKTLWTPNDVANKVKELFFFFFYPFCLNKPFNLFRYSLHIPHFSWNNERQGERRAAGRRTEQLKKRGRDWIREDKM